ncbi:MAG: MBL fold metallo-hydrolase [Candidatus Heimdallarchaeota archaeon]|nr:MBL fold metallo-hydrolase [Candidatus Heimdallarchaeota archaeon]
MIFEKIVSKGIASNSYFVASEGEAAVIDPRRDIDVYLNLAKEKDVKIKAIFDTHRNEDFVNGSPELAHETSAEIYHGQRINFKYGKPVKEGFTFHIGELVLCIMETPGHTPESISIGVKTDTSAKRYFMVFTGDTLFAGDVGRIDFYRDAKKQREAANWLYDSLYNKLLALDDSTVIFPAHGAGSICGGGISGLPFSTIGYEKETNQKLQLTKEEFVNFKSIEQFEIAPNMSILEKFNLEGAPILGGIIKPQTLSVKEVKEHLKKGSQVVDVREPESFAGGHIPNTISIWKNGLPNYALWLLSYDKPIVLIKSTHQDIEQSIRYLIRLGFDNVVGYLNGFRNWYMSGEKYTIPYEWSVHDLFKHLDDKDLYILDVRRNQNIIDNGRIKGSHHIFLGELPVRISEIPKDKQICVYCDSGFKAKSAASILIKNGFRNVTSVLGSITAWRNANYPIEEI